VFLLHYICDIVVFIVAGAADFAVIGFAPQP
jgi:hypothetical protein